MKNKIILIHLMLILALGLTFCGKQNSTQTKNIKNQPAHFEEFRSTFSKAELSQTVATDTTTQLTISDLIGMYEDKFREAKYIPEEAENIKNFIEEKFVQGYLLEKATAAGYADDDAVKAREKASLERALLRVVQDREIRSKIDITDAMVKAYYEENKETEYKIPAQVRVSRIVVPTKKEAVDVIKRLRKGEKFYSLTRKLSTADKSFYTIRANSEKYADIKDEAFAIKETGQISPIFETEDGFNILLLRNKSEEKIPSLDELSRRIRTELYVEKLESLETKLMNEWKDELDITIHEDKLATADLKKADPQEVIAEITPEQKITFAEFTAYYNPTEEDNLEKRLAHLDRVMEDPIKIEIAKEKGYADAPETQRMLKEERERAMIQEFYADWKEENVSVSEEEMKEFYEKSKYEIRARHILVESEPKAVTILEEIKSGGDFGELAKELSVDKGTAVRGGELGYFKWGVMVDGFQDAAFSLDNGEISDVVETELGYHIIEVTDRRPNEDLLPYEKMKTRINTTITGIKTVRVTDELFEQLKREAHFEFNEQAIKLFVEKVNEYQNEKKKLESESAVSDSIKN
jgi:parvulin-like peptidyl-prolyl isomerase